MSKSTVNKTKKQIFNIILRATPVIPTDENDLSVQQTRQLEFFIKNGHWEILVKNKVFLQLAPEGQVQTLVKSLENRLKILRTNLTPLGRSERTRDAYIQILNHIHDLERLQDEILKKFYADFGKRQIDKDSKGKKIDF